MYIFIRRMKNENELLDYTKKRRVKDKLLIKIKKCTNIPTLKKIDNLHYLYIVPKIRSAKELNGIIAKVRKKLKETDKIILSVDLKKYTDIMQVQDKIKIMPYFILEILNYITNIWNSKTELQNVYILAKGYNGDSLNIIDHIVNKVKNTTIITNNYNKYKKYEEKILDEKGLLITITNNKRKALEKATLIVNLDFNSKELNMYRINRDAIIINCTNEKMNIPYLQGIIINDINIRIEEKEEYKMLLRRFFKL